MGSEGRMVGVERVENGGGGVEEVRWWGKGNGEGERWVRSH